VGRKQLFVKIEEDSEPQKLAAYISIQKILRKET